MTTELERHDQEAYIYKKFIEEAANKYAIPPSLIVAIMSRESGCGLLLKPPGPTGTGDFSPRQYGTPCREPGLPPDGQGFGRGLMQIDWDAHEFARDGIWEDPRQNILFGAAVLHQSYVLIDRIIPHAEDELKWKAAAAGYNCGPGNVIKSIRAGKNVDAHTTHGNYGEDVMMRAEFFRSKGWG